MAGKHSFFGWLFQIRSLILFLTAIILIFFKVPIALVAVLVALLAYSIYRIVKDLRTRA